jgi:SAM-dependent methyltransferase
LIIEEFTQPRIRDLLAAATIQIDMIRRVIIEAEPCFQLSRLKSLLSSREWPYAVNPNLMIDRKSERDQMERARSIISMLIPQQIRYQSFLDFGCGEGYVARAAVRGSAKNVVGYDPVKQWDRSPAHFLTDKWNEVVDRGPYDFVMVYDVFDHSVESPVDSLKKIRSVMSPQGFLMVRCHPWCSRTGNHSYLNRNKAYIHLLFPEDQLEEIGAKGIFTRKITHPIVTYDDWFLKSGFRKLSENVRREEVEPIWSEEPILRDIIQSHWKTSYEANLANGTKFPTYQLEQQFLDFLLVPDDKEGLPTGVPMVQ